MKTIDYNPSPIEVSLAQAFCDLTGEIEGKMNGYKITVAKNNIDADNPMVIFQIMDEDNDAHEVVLKIIQRPDKF